MPFRHRLSAQVVLYALIGLAQLVFDALLFLFLARRSVDPYLANGLSRLSAGLLGYLCHAVFTFRSDRPPHTATSLRRFLAWWVFCTVLGGWVLSLGPEAVARGSLVLGLKVTLELALALASFLVLRTWVFRPRRGRRVGPTG